MTRNLLTAALLTTLAAPVLAEKSPHGGAEGGVTIVVSCDRGPMIATLLDHPAPAFIDSLVAAGYGYAEATAIGLRICRDRSLMGDPEAMTAEMRRIYTTTR